MIHITDKTKCCGCEACAQVCPAACISMEPDGEGFRYPVAEAGVCIDCRLCESTCPVLVPNVCREEVRSVYAAYSLDELNRASSSSGGVFYELAKSTISKGGVICAAAYDEQFNVHHVCVEHLAGIKKLQGSKYVQSFLGNSFSEVKQHLEEGREVLFVGTECQVVGLNRALGKKYDNLLCVGVVCHGVPSQRVWQCYRSEVSKGTPLTELNMRDKSSGWSHYRYSWKFSFENGKEKLIPQGEVPFMTGFVSDYYLRPSCYDCSFKGLSRCADITLGDFWGVWDSNPEMDDDKGTSLVMVHSKKGQDRFDRISPALNISEASLDDAVQSNPSVVRSAVLTPKRDEFFRQFETGKPVETIVSELHEKEPSVERRIKRKLKEMFPLLH